MVRKLWGGQVWYFPQWVDHFTQFTFRLSCFFLLAGQKSFSYSKINTQRYIYSEFGVLWTSLGVPTCLPICSSCNTTKITIIMFLWCVIFADKAEFPLLLFSFKSILASLISFFSIVQMWSNSRQIYTKLLMESYCLHIIDTELSSFSKKDSFQSLVKMMQVYLVSCLWVDVSWEMLASSDPFPSHHLVTWRCWLSARFTVTSGFRHLQLSGVLPLPTDFTHVFLELLLSLTSTIWFLVSENQPPQSKPQDGLLGQGFYLSPTTTFLSQGLESTVFVLFYCLKKSPGT